MYIKKEKNNKKKYQIKDLITKKDISEKETDDSREIIIDRIYMYDEPTSKKNNPTNNSNN